MKHGTLTDRVASLLPGIADRAAATEDARTLPTETIAEFQDSGLLRALQPTRYGGGEHAPEEFFDAVSATAAACASSAWVLSVLGVHSWHLALFDTQAQDDVWGTDPAALLCSSYATAGTVEPVDGGYVLRGTWPFSSGSDHAQWALLGGNVPQGANRPALVDDEGQEWPDVRTFLVPKADFTLMDNWFVAGLSGSGSKQIHLDGVFVPEHRTHRFLDIRRDDSPGLQVNTSGLYRLPFGSLFCYAISAPIIGTARGTYTNLLAEGRERAPVSFERGRQEDAPLQVRIARTAAELDGLTLQLHENFRTMRATVDRGDRITIDIRSRVRWDAARAAEVATDCVDRVFAAAGGRAIFLANPIQRAFRDAHAMRAHAYNNTDHAAQIMGRAELGLPNRELLI